MSSESFPNADPKDEDLAGAESNWPFQRVLVLGVGLLGGSVVRSIKRISKSTTVIGLARREATANSLRKWGELDQVVQSPDEIDVPVDVAVVATPVHVLANALTMVESVVRDDGLITDVGSTKASIADSVIGKGRLEALFVPAHPIAGSEQSGWEASSESLFVNKWTLITPTPTVSEERIRLCEVFWQGLGSQTAQISPQDHDLQLASVSHLPHLVSSAVVNATTAPSRKWAGSGWRDITRVASGNPSMWAAIVSENRAAILQELSRFEDEMSQLRKMLGSEDVSEMLRWLERAKKTRDDLVDPESGARS